MTQSQYDVTAIIQGYAQGYFLMANESDTALSWYSSRERALIPLDHRFRYPRSLQRVLNQKRFHIAISQDFQAAVAGCADRETTWISDELREIYWQLHLAGWAHSFETWHDDKLAGAILGIAIGGAFIGESMFYSVPEASKVAMVKLVEWLRLQQFSLFDAQMTNPHLERFGAYIVSQQEYEKLLRQAIQSPCSML